MARAQQSSQSLSVASRHRWTSSLYALLALSAGVFLQPAVAQESACQRWGGSNALSNNKFFYSGGWYRSSKPKDSIKVSRDLVSIDLSSSWKVADATITKYDKIPELFSDKEERPVPILISGSDTIFSVFPAANKTQSYTFSSTESKIQTQASKINNGFNGIRNFAYTQSSTAGIVYAVGDDAKDQDKVVVTSVDAGSGNITIVEAQGVKPALPHGGLLQYLPVGEKGALVYLGGMNGRDKASLETVYIFDLSDSIWREQQTTGTAPAAKADLNLYCSAYAGAKDGSSHSIYVFASDGNVFILTLPAFLWIQVPTKGDAPDYEPQRKSWNTEGSCLVAPGSRQVVAFAVGSQDKDVCDNKNKGVYVYDMNDAVWKEDFDKDRKGYEIPLPVVAKIGGDRSGGATLKSPEREWSSSGLRRLFGQDEDDTPSQDDKDKNNDGNAQQTPTATPEKKEEKKEEKKGNGAVIGGVVAALLILGILAGLFIFYRRRRKQKEHNDHAKFSSQTSSRNMSTEDTKMDYDGYSNHPRRSSISKDDTIGEYSVDSLSTRWSPDPSTTFTPDPLRSPDPSGRKLAGTPASSTLYAHSTYMGDGPEPHGPFLGKIPGSPAISSIGSFKGYGHGYCDSIDIQVLTPTTEHAVELPTHFPKHLVHSNRTSTVSHMQVKNEIFGGELEGDYSFPIELGDSTPSSRRESKRGSSKKDSRRGSKELLLDSPSNVGTPEPALISPGLRPAEVALNRRSTGVITEAKQVGIMRSPSVQDRGRGTADVQEGIKMENITRKPVLGKAKLVDLKRGASVRKNLKEAGLPPLKATVAPGWDELSELEKDRIRAQETAAAAGAAAAAVAASKKEEKEQKTLQESEGSKLNQVPEESGNVNL